MTAEKAELAKDLRQQATETETLAWEILRNRRCLGLKFRRQQVIRGFIVDFYCAEHRLALELDGPIHDHQQEQDQKRDKALAQEGVRVLRIRNEEVTEDFLTATLSKAVEFTSSKARVPTSPSPDMERGSGGEDGDAAAYADAVSVFLGIALSRLSDICNALCRWEVTKTQVRNLFGRQAIPMIWDYAENNVFGKSAGDPPVSG